MNMIIFFGYLLINIFFYRNWFWNELFFDLSKIGRVFGEVQVYEWLTDKFYQLIISGQNPFGITKAILYPFGFNLGLVDAGYGLFFPLLRPFLSAHQTMSILITLSLLLANIGMYLLLRKLDINKIIAFIIGAAFGSMTFLMVRGGHLNYWCHFVFPWFYYFAVQIFQTEKKQTKILSTVGMSVFFVLALWLNFYYFVILLISIFSLLTFYFIFHNKLFIKKLKENWLYLILTGGLIFIWLIPWLLSLYDMFMFNQVPRTTGWGGAIQFSSEIINYFIPSEYGYLAIKYPFLLKPIYFIVRLLAPNLPPIFENFTYPGIIILGSYLALIIFYRKINNKIKKNILPFLFVSIIFFILTFGPFLHLFGHWMLTVDEGIKIVIPLPYIFLHYIPFLNNIRVPGRLAVGFIFFAYIVAAYLINDYYYKINSKKRWILIFVLFVIFFSDHLLYVNMDVIPKNNYPNNIFEEIKKDKEFSTVLEIPFTVRDGFTFFGDGNAFQMIIGEAVHGKPVLGGYTGRIADYIKTYYQKNPFLGYVGRIIDGDLINNPGMDKTDLNDWKEIDLPKSKDSIDFLNLKYILVNNEKNYAASLSATIKELGFNKRMDDEKHTLWVKNLDKKEFINIDMKDKKNIVFLGFGWNEPEGDFRWVERRSSVMFKLAKKRQMILNFQAEAFYKEQSVTIYLNKKKVAKINLSVKKKNYSIPLDKEFNEGINTVHFIFDKYYRPYDTIPSSLDKRRLAAKFYKLFLTEKN
ncbi:MAG: hypothetical protein ACD_12C00312G0021 [uncultured bacterium]|nr:MAG: hypothetical protein ACD_12C00312G0021 [uncultured bacterium]